METIREAKIHDLKSKKKSKDALVNRLNETGLFSYKQSYQFSDVQIYLWYEMFTPSPNGRASIHAYVEIYVGDVDLGKDRVRNFSMVDIVETDKGLSIDKKDWTLKEIIRFISDMHRKVKGQGLDEKIKQGLQKKIDHEIHKALKKIEEAIKGQDVKSKIDQQLDQLIEALNKIQKTRGVKP